LFQTSSLVAAPAALCLCSFVVQEMKKFHFLVHGGGIVGLFFALKVAPRGRAAAARDFYFTGAMSGMVWRSKRR
jgi:hypothetical protein